MTESHPAHGATRAGTTAARASLLVTALLFSTGGAAIKATTLSNWQIVTWRSAIAAVMLWLFAGRRVRLTKATLIVALAQAGTMVTFVTANKLTTAASSVFFQGTAPLYIALIGPWWLGERLPRRDYPVLLAIAAGIGLLFIGTPTDAATAPHPTLGNIVGTVSGCCWALTVMGLRWMTKHEAAASNAAASATVLGNVLACLVCAPMAWPLAGIGAQDLGIVVYLGVFQVGLSYLLLGRSLAKVPAVDASLLLLAEPAFSPFWAWLVHGELPGAWPLLGGVLIVGSTTWKTWRDRRTANGPPEGGPSA
jgi:drug/metabolite transporter (DMT)-like permease